MRMYSISKQVVSDAYKKVKANGGAPGADKVTMAEFEERLEDNLYKIWNRMSSGSYMAPSVRMVEIPKSDGKIRRLGIPTIADRVAQMVAKIYLEPQLEPHFHPDSYGYRPGKSAHDAIGMARKRCWRYDWAIDLDIKGFFDNLDHELVMKAVEKHTELKWLHLYIKRWLKAPMQTDEGQMEERTKGTPQGGVISPLLANLFLHYAFDEWMKRENPNNPFERYADDIIVHCRTQTEAESLKQAIEERLRQCKLELHPEKTKIVYCKSDDRPGSYPTIEFDFLGYGFKPRAAKSRRGRIFTGFLPAVSTKAMKAMRKTIRSWQNEFLSGESLEAIAKRKNPIITGWLNYYGRFYRSALIPLMEYLNKRIVRWMIRKHKRLKRSLKRGVAWLTRIMRKDCHIFVHWAKGFQSISEQ